MTNDLDKKKSIPSKSILGGISIVYVSELSPRLNNIGLLHGSKRAHILNTLTKMANFRLMQHSSPKHRLSKVQYTFLGKVKDIRGQAVSNEYNYHVIHHSTRNLHFV